MYIYICMNYNNKRKSRIIIKVFVIMGLFITREAAEWLLRGKLLFSKGEIYWTDIRAAACLKYI